MIYFWFALAFLVLWTAIGGAMMAVHLAKHPFKDPPAWKCWIMIPAALVVVAIDNILVRLTGRRFQHHED
jgi:hypothetical protein